MDMTGNYKKLEIHYQKDVNKNYYLEDLILLDLNNPENNSKISLLWLKR